MPTLFSDLRDRLLRAGVAPRHVRRYLAELADHLADLKAEEERAGRSTAEIESAALARLGGMDQLASAMIEQRRFQALSARAPWAAYGLVPLLLLAVAYLGAGSILWSGWKLFLPGSASPFVQLHGLAIFYFGVGRLVYFGAPVVIGWMIGAVAVQQRSPAIWPLVGLICLAVVAGALQFHTDFPRAAETAGHVWVSFDLPASSPMRILGTLLLTVSPYLAWRLASAPGTVTPASGG